jgi:hypothetical protein
MPLVSVAALLLALAVGIALGCGPDPQWCASPLGCDHCRDCAIEPDGACADPWSACTFDPSCDAILVCVDDCPLAVFADCERECRGTNLGGAVLYDDLLGCLDDACTLHCE